MPPRQAAARQEFAIVKVVAGARLATSHDVEQFVMSNRAKIAAHFSHGHGQGLDRCLAETVVITHGFFALKVEVDGPKAV